MKSLTSKEVKIGIAFILAIIILYVGINFLKGVNIFKPSNSYVVIFDDVTDLTVSTPVVLNGYQIGLVHSMKLDPKDDSKILVDINLNKGLKIPKGSTIKLDVSIMGAATLTINKNSEAKDFYTSDDIIPGIRSGSVMESVSNKILPQVDNIVPRIDSILIGLDMLVRNPALQMSLQNMNTITQDLTTTTKQLNQLMSTLNKDLPQLSNNMVDVSNDLTKISGEVKNMDVASTFKSLDASMKNLQNLTEKINSKDGSLGLLINDKSLYDSLNMTLGNAGLLLKDIKENPSKYINIKVF